MPRIVHFVTPLALVGHYGALLELKSPDNREKTTNGALTIKYPKPPNEGPQEIPLTN